MVIKALFDKNTHIFHQQLHQRGPVHVPWHLGPRQLHERGRDVDGCRHRRPLRLPPPHPRPPGGHGNPLVCLVGLPLVQGERVLAEVVTVVRGEEDEGGGLFVLGENASPRNQMHHLCAFI